MPASFSIDIPLQLYAGSSARLPAALDALERGYQLVNEQGLCLSGVRGARDLLAPGADLPEVNVRVPIGFVPVSANQGQ